MPSSLTRWWISEMNWLVLGCMVMMDGGGFLQTAENRHNWAGNWQLLSNDRSVGKKERCQGTQIGTMWLYVSKILESQLNFLGTERASPSITRFIKRGALELIQSLMCGISLVWSCQSYAHESCLAAKLRKKRLFSNPGLVPLAVTSIVNSLFQWDIVKVECFLTYNLH